MLRSPVSPSLLAIAAVFCAAFASSGCVRDEDPGESRPTDRPHTSDAAPVTAPRASGDAAAASSTADPHADPHADKRADESTDPATAAAPDSGVAQAKPVSFRIQEPWASHGANVRASLAFDQPTVQQPGATAADTPTTVYAGPKDFGKLVIYLHCTFDTHATDAPADATHGPLAQLESVQVFSGNGVTPIAVFTREQMTYSVNNQAGIERDGRGAVVSTIEHVRIPFWEHGALVRDHHPYAFTVVALDHDGRTMAAEEVKGDEAVDPITPWQR